LTIGGLSKYLPLPICIALLSGCSSHPPDSPAPPKHDTPVTPPAGPPRLEIKQTEQDIGGLDFSVPRECKFTVRNAGGQPLTLTFVNKSCFCTDATVPEEPIGPGAEGTVSVRWNPIPGKSGPERIKAEFETNDPDRPRLQLEVTGIVNPLIRIAPENMSFIDFYRLQPGDVKPRELKVFSTKLDLFDLEAKSELAELKVTTARIDPASSGRIGDDCPKCVYSILIETTPQLPPGFFMTDLVLTVRAPSAPAREIRMRVYGEVANGLFKVLPKEIEFTALRLADGDQRRVRVQFIDPGKKQTLKIVKIEPPFVECTEPRLLPGAPGQWEFTARIPPQNADAVKFQPDGFFEGRVVLEASGSNVRIPVRLKWNRPESNEPRQTGQEE
jgi:hypothetical protein